jgi:hypothetical protein
MMLIGTSFGGCIKSLLKGEVHMDDVLVIIARTAAKDLDGLMSIVEEYHSYGNGFATVPDNYSISDMDLDEAKSIATSLYQHGKIHQPRLYNGFGGFVHIELSRNEIWIPLAPSPKTDEQMVVDAYNKYMVLRNLMA